MSRSWFPPTETRLRVADLVAGYDLVIFDLDGVLYLADQVIPGAVEATTRLRERGVPAAYATNNASRLAGDVASLLTSLGIAAGEGEVVTSAGASARLLAERLPAGAAVLVVGAPALEEEIRVVGLRPVGTAEEAPASVLQGYGPDVGWRHLAEASVAIRAGTPWVATNADRTLPSPRGPLPGNGSLVAALATALGRQPDTIVGKPDPGLFLAAARERGAVRPLVVGDRLDTDIEGANRAGMDSLLVLTGVSRPVDLLGAAPERRPTYLAEDLSGLFTEPELVTVHKENSWRVTERDSRWELSGDGTAVDALRVLCAAAWAAGTTRPVIPAGSAAEDALRQLGL
jgi:glycerol 3-phosphatase-2